MASSSFVPFVTGSHKSHAIPHHLMFGISPDLEKSPFSEAVSGSVGGLSFGQHYVAFQQRGSSGCSSISHTRSRARALIALGELATMIILNLLELWAFMALMILVIATVASTTPDNVSLRLEAGVR